MKPEELIQSNESISSLDGGIYDQPTKAILSNPKDKVAKIENYPRANAKHGSQVTEEIIMPKQNGNEPIPKRPIVPNYFGPSSRRYANRNENSSFINNEQYNIPEFFNDAIANNSLDQKKNRGKKPILIVVIICILLIIGGGVAAFLLMQQKNSNPVSTKKLFNTYANFILSGDTSDADIPDYEYKDYKILSVFRSDNTDEVNSYMSNAKKYYDNFLNAYKETSNSYDLLVAYNSHLENIIFNNTVTRPSDKVVLELYKNGSKDNISDLINKTYSSKTSVSSYEKELWLNYVKILDIYKSKGCLSGGKIVEECVSSIRDDSYSKLISRQSELAANIDGSIETSKRALLMNLWEINKLFMEENNSEN